LIAADEEGRTYNFALGHALRKLGVFVELDHASKSLKAQMRRADRLRSQYVLVVGAQEIKSKQGQLKKLSDRQILDVALDAVSISQAVRQS